MPGPITNLTMTATFRRSEIEAAFKILNDTTVIELIKQIVEQKMLCSDYHFDCHTVKIYLKHSDNMKMRIQRDQVYFFVDDTGSYMILKDALKFYADKVNRDARRIHSIG